MWIDILIAALFVLAVWGFLSIAGLSTRILTRRTGRTAESMYGSNDRLTKRQRRKARRDYP